MSEESFSPEWLALREPVDHRSRAAGLIPLLNSWWESHEGSHIVDLGSGTGSNLRYLAPLLRGEQLFVVAVKRAASPTVRYPAYLYEAAEPGTD